VAVSPHYYYPTDKGWKFEGALEKVMHKIGMFNRTGAYSLKGFDKSGADFMPQYKKYIHDGKTIITSPHKVYGPEQNDLVLQLRKNRVEQLILAGMSANLCVESHLRELLEQGFEVAVVRDATAAALRGGWLHTGDLGVMHPDGYIEIKDRAKDIIISGGENISSVEVEGVLMGHPDVLLAAVVAAPDDKWGEVPCAFVELKEGASVDAAGLIAFSRETLAGFKAPKRVVFQELPKTSTGKIQKFELREVARNL